MSTSELRLIFIAVLFSAFCAPITSAVRLPGRQLSRSTFYPLPNQTSIYLGSSGVAVSTVLSGTLPGSTGFCTSCGFASTGKARLTTPSLPLHSAPSATSTRAANTPQAGLVGGLGVDTPIFNLNNNTCNDMSALNASQQWAAVDGDLVVETFQNMYQNNLLVCDDCYGIAKDKCNSKDPKCSNGLRDLSTISGGGPRWDTAAAHFAMDSDTADLQCRIQIGECTGAPSCKDCNGPGSFAVLKSLQVLNTALNNIYNAVQQAGQHCSNQMTVFSSTFAPVPDIKDKSISLGIMTSIVGGLFGFIPGVGGAVAGMMSGVGSSVMMDEFLFNQPGPADTASVLGQIANNTAQQISDMADGLFTNGTYDHFSADGSKISELTLQTQMKGGNLMQSSAGKEDLFSVLVPTFEKIMYQQLAFYTWTYLQKDDQKHTPFIIFTPGPCETASSQSPGFGSNEVLENALTVKSSITYNDTCYWLLDGTKTTKYIATGGLEQTRSIDQCGIGGALPGGTVDDFDKNKDVFQDLALEDFIIPSVNGWAKNGKNNDYDAASANGQLVADPRTAGAINIPVCDYVGNKDLPGVNCPKLGTGLSKDGGCDLVPRNAIGNSPGGYAAGMCKVHVKQYQKNEGDENIFNNYQLEIIVYDDAGRPVGDAAKELASVPLAVEGSLPFQLIAGVSGNDNDPVEFWYADDYWNSNDQSHKCSTGAYDSGMRQMDCQFPCPAEDPSFGDSHSATIGHHLFAAPTEAVIGDQTFANTYQYPTPTAAPTPTTPPPVPDNIKDGQCHVHVRQHQKNEPDNKTPNYELEVTIWDKLGHPVGQSGMVPAPAGKPVTITGLSAPFTVTTQNVDSDALKLSLKKLSWDTTANTDPKCKVGGYDSGARDMDCWFACNPGD